MWMEILRLFGIMGIGTFSIMEVLISLYITQFLIINSSNLTKNKQSLTYSLLNMSKTK